MSAWTVIAHTELGSAQATITFSSIAGTYTDLFLFISGRNSLANNDNEIVTGRFNGNSDAIYSFRQLLGNGSTAASSSASNNTGGNFGRVPQNGRTASTFSNIGVYIPNYTSSVAKSFSVDSVEENNATDSTQFIIAGLWNNTAAITSIELSMGAGNFMQYTSATLYGILKGSSGGVSVS